MTGTRQRGLRHPAALALAGVAVLALAGCASAAPEATPAGGPGAVSATGAMARTQPGTTAQPATTAAGRVSTDSRLTTATSVGTASRVNPAGPASRPHCNSGSAFALSLVSGYYGWASPVEAAQQFSHQSDPSGYGTPNTVWTASAPDSSGVTLTATDLMLHAVRLPNGRWAIDSGERCD
ncbi:MAG: hypothetical protein ABI047_04765 [Jatrophihabitantaceae bacterium]